MFLKIANLSPGFEIGYTRGFRRRQAHMAIKKLFWYSLESLDFYFLEIFSITKKGEAKKSKSVLGVCRVMGPIRDFLPTPSTIQKPFGSRLRVSIIWTNLESFFVIIVRRN